MAVAAWRVWRAQPTTSTPDARSRRQGLVLYAVQLALNALWTWLFFAWHQGALATVEIVGLWLVIAATIRQFSRVDAPAAWMLAPYLAWVSFATALSWTIWRSNPGIL
jgi:benzodiazapine receptor